MLLNVQYIFHKTHDIYKYIVASGAVLFFWCWEASVHRILLYFVIIVSYLH